jgi:competence protein ComEC
MRETSKTGHTARLLIALFLLPALLGCVAAAPRDTRDTPLDPVDAAESSRDATAPRADQWAECDSAETTAARPDVSADPPADTTEVCLPVCDLVTHDVVDATAAADAGDLSATDASDPDAAGDVGDVPGDVGDVPGDVGDVPGDVGDVPGDVGDVPGDVGAADDVADGADDPPPPAPRVTVHFLDVGQGDSILIEAVPGPVVLIDGGPSSAAKTVVDYLVARGIRVIDLVIATHPHADHIGGLPAVLERFPVRRVIDSGTPHTTLTYDRYLTALERQVEAGDCVFETAAGQVFRLAPAVTLTVLGPHPAASLTGLNNNSVVTRLDAGAVSFLFQGDAEQEAEADLLSRGVALSADVLKAGHHGSFTSTTEPFLVAVAPRYAVVMVGRDNRYGHPHPNTLNRLAAHGVTVLRTDLDGTVVFATDGVSLWLDPR